MFGKPLNLEKEVNRTMSYDQFRDGYPYNFPAWYFSGVPSPMERRYEARMNRGEFNPEKNDHDKAAECFERLKREHPKLVQKIKDTIDGYKHSVPNDEEYIGKLYEAYNLMRSYGATAKSISVNEKF